MDLEECKKKGIIRRVRIDTHLVKSIMEMSDIKENIVADAALDAVNINGFFQWLMILCVKFLKQCAS